MSTNLDAVIKNVASINGAGLEKSDALMVLVTIINQLTEDQQAGVVTALEKYKEVHEGIALRWRTDAAKVADKFLNAALTTCRAETSKSMIAGANQIIKLINDTLSAALEEQRAEAREMMKNMRTLTTWMMGSVVGALVMALVLGITLLVR